MSDEVKQEINLYDKIIVKNYENKVIDTSFPIEQQYYLSPKLAEMIKSTNTKL